MSWGRVDPVEINPVALHSPPRELQTQDCFHIKLDIVAHDEKKRSGVLFDALTQRNNDFN